MKDEKNNHEYAKALKTPNRWSRKTQTNNPI